MSIDEALASALEDLSLEPLEDGEDWEKSLTVGYGLTEVGASCKACGIGSCTCSDILSYPVLPMDEATLEEMATQLTRQGEMLRAAAQVLRHSREGKQGIEGAASGEDVMVQPGRSS